jgi:methylmalonyl-CoA mutase N-terminal domain/subunit
MYLVVAEKQGADLAHFRHAAERHPQGIHRAEGIHLPPRPSMRLVTDTIEFGARHTPRFNPISISGYHIREAGSTALQELAFTLRDGSNMWTGRSGAASRSTSSLRASASSSTPITISSKRSPNTAPPASSGPTDARTLWREGRAQLKLRFHAQTAGCSLTWQQPYNNVVRTALQAMAAVLGGAQSLHTNSLDEAYALPSEHAATLALRTQQVIAYESGITAEPDPFGGSYFVEHLTTRAGSGRTRVHREDRRNGRHDPGYRKGLSAG